MPSIYQPIGPWICLSMNLWVRHPSEGSRMQLLGLDLYILCLLRRTRFHQDGVQLLLLINHWLYLSIWTRLWHPQIGVCWSGTLETLAWNKERQYLQKWKQYWGFVRVSSICWRTWSKSKLKDMRRTLQRTLRYQLGCNEILAAFQGCRYTQRSIGLS